MNYNFYDLELEETETLIDFTDPKVIEQLNKELGI